MDVTFCNNDFEKFKYTLTPAAYDLSEVIHFTW